MGLGSVGLSGEGLIPRACRFSVLGSVFLLAFLPGSSLGLVCVHQGAIFGLSLLPYLPVYLAGTAGSEIVDGVPPLPVRGGVVDDVPWGKGGPRDVEGPVWVFLGWEARPPWVVVEAPWREPI